MAGESSAASEGQYRHGGSYKMLIRGSYRKKTMNRMSRGSAARLKDNVRSTESQKELFMQAGLFHSSVTPGAGIVFDREDAVKARYQTR